MIPVERTAEHAVSQGAPFVWAVFKYPLPKDDERGYGYGTIRRPTENRQNGRGTPPAQINYMTAVFIIEGDKNVAASKCEDDDDVRPRSRSRSRYSLSRHHLLFFF